MRTSAIRGIGKLCSSAQVVSSKRCRTSGARWISTPSSSDGHQWSTPLAKQLAEAITTTGPIPVAAYMRQCLTSDLGGYYTATTPSPQKDQFGAKGDFVTSPEISQVFGELIGVWVVAEWIAQGRRADGVYLMEVGPGRGTLMADMLRVGRLYPQILAEWKLMCIDRPYVTFLLLRTRLKLYIWSKHRLTCAHRNTSFSAVTMNSEQQILVTRVRRPFCRM